MYKYPWMKSWLIIFDPTGVPDVSGQSPSIAYTTVPARVTYGDRFVLTSQGGLGVFQAEAYTVQETYDWVQEYGANQMVEISYDYGTGIMDGSSLPGTSAGSIKARDFILNEIRENGEVFGDLVQPNTFMLKRSLYNRKRGYYYLGRSGGEG